MLFKVNNLFAFLQRTVVSVLIMYLSDSRDEYFYSEFSMSSRAEDDYTHRFITL